MTPTPRSGITLVEVLVVGAILALILAIVAPAIQKVREIANRTQCIDNLRQIAAAVHRRHETTLSLPPGYYGPVRANGQNTKNEPSRGPWVGSLVTLLPYLSNDGLYNDLQTTPRSYPPTGSPSAKTLQNWCGLEEECAPWFTNSANLTPRTGGRKIRLFECPSGDTDTPASQGVIVQLYVANGEFSHIAMADDVNLGRTNYVGVAGAAGDYDTPGNAWLAIYTGVLFNRSNVTLGQVTVQDGAGYTMMFGESLGGGVRGGRDTAFSWFGAGALGTAYGLGDPRLPHGGIKPPPPGTAPQIARDGSAWYRFGSWHPTGVQFAFCDGSVRNFKFGATTTPTKSMTSDWALLQQFAGRNDGINHDESAIIE